MATTILRRIGIVALTATVVFALALSLVQVLGIARLVPVLSGSMRGFVDAGDAALLRPVATTDLAVDDVIAYYPPLPNAPLTLHRIVELQHEGDTVTIRTKGDANVLADPWTAQLEGATTWRADGRVLPGLGRVVLRLQRPVVRVLLLAVTSGLLLWAALHRIWHDPPDPRHQRARATPVASLLLGAVATAAIIHGLGNVTGAAATWTAGAAATQQVTASWASPPSELSAALVCDAGVPTAVRLTWVASPSPAVTGYVVERGDDDGAFVEIGRVTTTGFTDEALDAAGAGQTTYRVRGLTGSSTTPPTSPVGFLAVCQQDTVAAAGQTGNASMSGPTSRVRSSS